MADCFIAEIRAFPYTFAPLGWALCNGQLIPIQQNTVLFSLIGTYYGGNGTSNFALPNLQGSLLVHAGGSAGPGLQPVVLGESAGESSVTLLSTEMPVHSHTMQAGNTPGNLTDPTGAELTRASGGYVYDVPPASPTVPMATSMISPVGGSQPHNNLMPYLTLNYCIALQGIFPPRS